MNADDNHHISDAALLDNYYRDRNNNWLGTLLQRYTMMLFGVCMKYMKNEEDAKDCVQQIFLKAITELDKYKVVYFKSWIYMVAKNHCLMKLRDRQGKTAQELHEDQNAEAPQTDKHTAIAKEEVISLLEQAVQTLNPEQKQCVTLFYLDKRSYQQIAFDTGFTMLQVKSYIQNGKRNLKMQLEAAYKKSRET